MHAELDEEIQEYLRAFIVSDRVQILQFQLLCRQLKQIFSVLAVLPFNVYEAQVGSDLLICDVTVARNENILHGVDHLGVEGLPVFVIHLVVLYKDMPEAAQREVIC